MRHSDPKLTANVYTDPKLLDVRGALDALPSLPLGEGPTVERDRARATGTDAHGPCAVAPLVALNRGNERQTPCIQARRNTASGLRMDGQRGRRLSRMEGDSRRDDVRLVFCQIALRQVLFLESSRCFSATWNADAQITVTLIPSLLS
jgi:hypothetical protein